MSRWTAGQASRTPLVPFDLVGLRGEGKMKKFQGMDRQ
jgi:hypothetical protein